MTVCDVAVYDILLNAIRLLWATQLHIEIVFFFLFFIVGAAGAVINRQKKNR